MQLESRERALEKASSGLILRSRSFRLAFGAALQVASGQIMPVVQPRKHSTSFPFKELPNEL